MLPFVGGQRFIGNGANGVLIFFLKPWKLSSSYNSTMYVLTRTGIRRQTSTIVSS